MKHTKLFTLTILLLFVATACAKPLEVHEKEKLESDIGVLVSEKKTVEEEIRSLKEANELERYIVTIEIKQSHMWIDFEKRLKDEANAIEIDIPVDKGFFDQVDVGTVLNDDFRAGSFWLEGSYGHWDIKVIGKEVQHGKLE